MRQHEFDDQEKAFRELWGPIASEVGEIRVRDTLGRLTHDILDHRDLPPVTETGPDGKLRRKALPFGQRKTMPSREFLVTQACLNAAVAEDADCVDGLIARAYLRGRSFYGTLVTQQFADVVCAEFRKLESQYHA